MRVRTGLTLVLLVAIALSGCIGGQSGANNASDNSSAEAPSNETTLGYDEEVPESAKTSDKHRHQQWDGQDKKTLYNGTVQAGDCYGTIFMALFLVFNAAFEQRVERGCAYVTLGNGTLVPQGTEKLEIEVDASQARQSGGYDLQTWTDENAYRNPTTTEDTTTWWVELAKEDWDGPHESRSDFFFFSQAQAQETGGIAQLEGPMEFTITAHKIPNWTPPLAGAHVDHWQLNGTHTFVNDDAIETLNKNQTVYSCTWLEAVNDDCNAWEQQVNLSDIIPPGTSEVVLGMTWQEVRNCAPAHSCDLEADVRSGSDGAYGEVADRGDGYVIYRYKVPDELPADSTYANESQTVVEPDIYQCAEGPEPADFSFCGFGNANWAPEADVTFYMEAWRTPVNMTDFVDRRGIGE